MKYLNREARLTKVDDNLYILEGDYTEEQIINTVQVRTYGGIVCMNEKLLADKKHSVVVLEYRSGIVMINVKYNGKYVEDEEEFDRYADKGIDYAIDCGYKIIHWNGQGFLATKWYVQDIQNELMKNK